MGWAEITAGPGHSWMFGVFGICWEVCAQKYPTTKPGLLLARLGQIFVNFGGSTAIPVPQERPEWLKNLSGWMDMDGWKHP